MSESPTQKNQNQISNPSEFVPPDSLAGQSPCCEIVHIPLADNERAAARFYRPDQSRTAAVYLHGIQSHSGWFVRSAEFLRQHGVTVLAPDRRGSGLNPNHRGHADHENQLLDDLDRAVDWLRQHTGFDKVNLIAVSWSGKLALTYAASHPAKIRSLALVAPGLCAKVDITLREKIAVGVNGVLHPHKLHRIPLDDPKLFTANPPMLDFIARDPLKLNETTAAFLIASRRLDDRVRKIIPQIKIPTHLFLAEHDRIIDNAATVDLLHPILTPMPNAAAGVIFYLNAHHTLDFEPDPQNFFADLVSVLSQ